MGRVALFLLVAWLLLFLGCASEEASAPAPVPSPAATEPLSDAQRAAAVAAAWEPYAELIPRGPLRLAEPRSVTATLRAEPGVALPARLQLGHEYRDMVGHSFAEQEVALADGTMELELRPGRNVFTIAPGNPALVPQRLGVVEWDPAGPAPDALAFTVRAGKEHTLTLRGPDEVVMADARVSVWRTHCIAELRSDADGRVRWRDLPQGTVSLHIVPERPGAAALYGYELDLTAGPARVLALPPERALTLQLADGADDAVQVYLLREENEHGDHHAGYPHRLDAMQPLPTSRGPAGLRVHGLAGDATHTLLVLRAMEHATVVVPPGEQRHRVQLQARHSVTVAVTGVEHLSRDPATGMPSIKLTRSYPALNFAAVTRHPVAPAADGSGVARIDGLLASTVSVQAGAARGERVTLVGEQTRIAIEAEPVAPEPETVAATLQVALTPPAGGDRGRLLISGSGVPDRVVSVADAATGVSVYAPARLRLRPDLLQGWWFEPTGVFAVEPATVGRTVELKAMPAGCLHGRIARPAELPQDAVLSVTLEPVPDPAHDGVLPPPIRVFARGGAQPGYISAPIPLGLTCVPTLSWGHAVHRGEPVRIDATRPVVAQDLAFGPLHDLTIRVVDAAGAPVTGARLRLSRHRGDHSRSYGGSRAQTDTDGRHVLRGVTPVDDGHHELVVSALDGREVRLRDVDVTAGELRVTLP